MRITYDENKRLKVLNERELNFEDAVELFDAPHLTRRDDREYDEERFISIGEMKGQVVLAVWTPREATRRIITMRKANHGEREKFYQFRDRRG